MPPKVPMPPTMPAAAPVRHGVDREIGVEPLERRGERRPLVGPAADDERLAG